MQKNLQSKVQNQIHFCLRIDQRYQTVMEAPFKAVALAMQIEKVSNNCCTPIQFKYLWQQSFRSLYITTILLASISHYLLDSGIVQQLFCVLKGKYISNLLWNSLSAFPQLCSYKRSCQRCFAFQALYKFCRVLNAERNLSLNLKYIYTARYVERCNNIQICTHCLFHVQIISASHFHWLLSKLFLYCWT